MSKNLNNLTKAELVALVEAQRATQPSVIESPPIPSGFSAVEKELLSALALNRIKDEQRSVDTDDTRLSIELENVSGMAIGIEVRDPFTNAPRALSFERPGQRHKISARQLRDMRNEFPRMFEMGYVAVVGEVTNNPNTVSNVATLVANTPVDGITGYVQSITSVDTCFKIYSYLEQRRYVNVDAKGVALETVDAKGNRTVTLETRQLPVNEMTFLSAIQRRISELSPAVVRNDA